MVKRGIDSLVKRIADLLEKLTAGSFLIGIYQDNAWAIAFGFGLLGICLFLTRSAARNDGGIV